MAIVAHNSEHNSSMCHLLLGPSQEKQNQARRLLNRGQIDYVPFQDDYVAVPVLIAGNKRYRGIAEIRKYVAIARYMKRLQQMDKADQY